MSDLLEKNRNLDLTQQAKIDLHLEFSALLKEFQISDAVKSKLLTDAFSKHNLYISLPFELSKLCPEGKIDEQKLIKLSFYSYLYFSSILCFDKYYDNQINIVDNKDLIRTFMFFVKEQALRGLFTIINQSSDFWKEFEDLKILFFKSSNIGNTIDYKNFNDNVFLELAKNKSILSYAYVYSLKYMFGQIENEKILLNGSEIVVKVQSLLSKNQENSYHKIKSLLLIFFKEISYYEIIETKNHFDSANATNYDNAINDVAN